MANARPPSFAEAVQPNVYVVRSLDAYTRRQALLHGASGFVLMVLSFATIRAVKVFAIVPMSCGVLGLVRRRAHAPSGLAPVLPGTVPTATHLDRRRAPPPSLQWWGLSLLLTVEEARRCHFHDPRPRSRPRSRPRWHTGRARRPSFTVAASVQVTMTINTHENRISLVRRFSSALSPLLLLSVSSVAAWSVWLVLCEPERASAPPFPCADSSAWA